MFVKAASNTEQTSAWVMRKKSARVTTGMLSAKVDFTRPHSGISIERIAGASPTGQRILGYSHVPPTRPNLVDHYVRGDDLIAMYLSAVKSSDGREEMKLTGQVYWRHIQTGADSLWQGFELVISLQTDLLGIAPRLKLATSLPAQNVFLVEDAWRHPVLEPVRESVSIDGDKAAAIFVQSANAGWCYLQSLYFMDAASCEKTEIEFSPDGVEIKSTLFVEHLEKGVIRRVRARGAFCQPTDVVALQLGEWFNEFRSSELALTVSR